MFHIPMEIALFAALLLAAIAGALFVWKRPRVESVPARSAGAGGRRSIIPSLGPATEPQTRFVELNRKKTYKLLNSAEQTLYHSLLEAMPNMIVFAQVGVAQLAMLRGRQDAEQLRSMAGRGVDFVVCRKDFSIVAAIELCWPQPKAVAGDRRDSEELKRNALERLGIPLIVFRPNQLPDADAISREIAAAIMQRNKLEAEREREKRA